jgi:hypothetical protein
MNLKLLLPTAVLAIAGTVWLGRAWHDSRQGLVTLHVNDAPFAEVCAALSRQTGKSFVADKTLDGKLTLDLKRVPLDEALDEVMRQAGGSWSQWHAIHSGAGGLTKLQAALRDRAPVEPAGWTNLAPVFEAAPAIGGWGSSGGAGGVPGVPEGTGRQVLVEHSGPAVMGPAEGGGGGEARIVVRRGDGPAVEPPGAVQDMDVQVGAGTREVRIGAGPGEGREPGSSRQIRVVTVSRDRDGRMTEETWSPEVVTMEKQLALKLGDHPPVQASLDSARAAAGKVQGEVSTLYVLKRMPGGFSLPPELMAVRRKGGGAAAIAGGDGKREVRHVEGMPPMESVDSIVNRTRAENYTKLTPEQRVRQAQERQAARTNRQDQP